MSDIQILIPLSALPEGTTLTAEGINEALGGIVDSRAEIDQMKARYNELADAVKSSGKNLNLILDDINDSFERAKALRRFAAVMISLGDSVREMP